MPELGRIKDYEQNSEQAMPGEQKVRLLGPYSVEGKTPGIFGPWPKLAELVKLDTGTLVLNAFVSITDKWTGGANLDLRVLIADPADVNTYGEVIAIAVRTGNSPAKPLTDVGSIELFNQTKGSVSQGEQYPAPKREASVFVNGLASAFAYVASPTGLEVKSGSGGAHIWLLVSSPASQSNL